MTVEGIDRKAERLNGRLGGSNGYFHKSSWNAVLTVYVWYVLAKNKTETKESFI